MSAARGTRGITVELNPEGLRRPGLSKVADACAYALRAEKVKNAMISITLLTPRRMAALNRKHLGHAGATDIITFGFRDPLGAVIGDIYICPDIAARNAKAFDRPVREELVRLAVHGALHVLGYEHPEGEERTRSRMWKRQEQLVRRVLAQ